MARSLFLLTISCIITIICGPIALSATDDVVLGGLNPEGIVETVPLPEPEPEPVPQVQSAVVNPIVPSISNYDVSAYVGSPKEFNSIAETLADGVIYKYRKMVYGHSRSTALGNLLYKNPNEVITITEGGVAYSYRVAFSALYTIDALYAKQSNGNTLMENIADGALGHSVALFTCQGNDRRVVFADAT